jgi:DNA ligase-1
MSGVMSVEGEPHVEWHVFDDYLAGGPFEVRTELAASRAVVDGHVWPIGHMYLQEVVELQRYEESRVSQGYEGVMLRDPEGPYKQGRSTLREGYLLKIKRFVTDEAKVVGVTELMHNDNELTTDERGYAKRSTHQYNKRPAGVLGSLEVVDKDDRAFSIGTGFTAEQRKNLWEGRQYLVGKTVTFKHFPIGVKDAPRFPTFVAFRDGRDM